MRDLIEEMLKKSGEKNINIYENPSSGDPAHA